MDKNNFLKIFENAVMVEEGSLTFDTVLDELEDWDSLAIATLLTEIEEVVGYEPDVVKINNCNTVQEVFEIVTLQPNK